MPSRRSRPCPLFAASFRPGSFLLVAALLAGACVPWQPARAQTAARLLTARGAETPIRLQQAGIDVDIGGGMATTTVDLVFRNPNGRMLEGELQFPLAPGQRVTGFALDMNGEMRPAVPVEKAKGRQVFEEIERRRVDPALLETTQGNNFRLRVYPIPAQGTRHVQITIAQTLERGTLRWAYRLPLPYAAGAESIRAGVTVHGGAKPPIAPDAMRAVQFGHTADGYHAELPREALAGKPLAVEGFNERTTGAWTGDFGDESYFYAEIPVDARSAPRALPGAVTLLWDSSGSGATRRHDLEFGLLEHYFRAVRDTEVRLVRLRDRAEAARTFRVRGGDWSALRRELEATVYDGATALGGWTPEAGPADVLLVSDGLENYGGRVFPTLPANQRLFALNAAAGADTARLFALAQRYRGRLIDLSAGTVDAAARALLTDGVRIAALEGEGLTDLQAETMEPQQGVLRVAGRRERRDGVLRVTLADADGRHPRTVAVPVTPASPRQALAPQLWAGWRIDALQADYELKRAEIARIGKRFGIASRDTSLIVLDTIDDYVRYDIAPPASMRREWEQRRANAVRTEASNRDGRIESVARQLEAKVAWWNKVFPKNPPPEKKPEPMPQPAASAPRERRARPSPAFAPMATAPAAPAPVAEAAPPSAQSTVVVTGIRASMQSTLNLKRNSDGIVDDVVPDDLGAPNAAPIGITLKKWTPDVRYLDRMKDVDAERAYAVYLDEKPDFANSTAFYLDVAEQLLDKGNRELALRVLSNLAEMDLENRHILRILGYRLLQAGAPDLAVPVFETVLRLAEEEPQSWRDLGLAYAAVGQPQKAVDTLYEVVVHEGLRSFAEVELITLAELNAVVAANAGKVDTGRIDPRLLRHMPLDLRVVLTWDADNSDMDLWVTDPDGEACMFSHQLTRQGGRMSRDVTTGYGPEEFSLRHAKPGRYKVEANFYGHRQQVVASATTLQLKLVTGFGTPHAKEQMVTLRLRGQGEKVLVGEFEVPEQPR